LEQHSDIGTKQDLARYRMNVAKQDLCASQLLRDANEFRGANNRAYYAIYHAISAVHALDGNAYRKHKDALSNFNRNYVKTEIFPRTCGHKIAQAAEIRHASDYDDFYVATKEEAEEQIDTAREVIEMIEVYLTANIDK